MIQSIFDKPKPTVVFEVISLRIYGQPKLRKPDELKGVKQAFSVDYIPKKCRCAVYINGVDVWIKHGDYFSESLSLPEEDRGMPLGYLAKKYVGERSVKSFIYPDAWGDIVLRNEAWICLRGLMRDITAGVFVLEIWAEILRQQERLHGWGTYDLCCTDMERFWERVVTECAKLQ